MAYRDQQKQLVNRFRAASPDQLTGQATLVPLRAGYKSDPALSLTSVLFIPPTLAREITRTLIDLLRAIIPQHAAFSLSLEELVPLQAIHHTYPLSENEEAKHA